MSINPKAFAITDYLHKEFSCSCGRTHKTALEQIVIEKGALQKLPSLLKGYHCPLIVCDENTYQAAGKVVYALLEKTGFSPLLHRFPQKELIPNETALHSLSTAHQPEVDIIIAVGSGTLNDLCKFFSFHQNLPYIIVATAPSMDGFASTVAPLIIGGMKITHETHVPLAIVGDVDILKEAPMKMITAGLGDILGKYTALTDWKLSHILNGEYYCPTLVSMVEESLSRVLANAEQVLLRNEQAVAAIMEALVLTGIAMSFAGNSRPASGSEHHLAHYWEMNFLFDGRTPVLHGTKVAIGTVLSAGIYDRLKSLKPDFAAARKHAATFDFAPWETNMRRCYRIAADQVIALEQQVGKNSPSAVLARLSVIEEKWDELMAMAKTSLPPASEIAAILKKLNASAYPIDEGVAPETVFDSIIAAKELRNRYTVLQLIYDLGLVQDFAQHAM